MARKQAEFQCFNWLRGVADDHRITLPRRFILMRLSLFRNGTTGDCYPSYDTVAEVLKVDRATIIRAVADGVRYGWLAPPTRRGPTSNSFDFTFPVDWKAANDVAPVHHQDTEDVAPVQHLAENDVAPVHNDVAPVHRRSRTGAQKMSHQCDPNGISNGITNGIKKRGKKTLSSHDASLDLPSEPEAQGTPSSTEPAAPPNSPAAKTGKRQTKPKFSEAELAASFAEFYAAYPKHAAKEEARKAYAKAIKGGAIAATLIAGAKRYAAERRGQDAKYTKYPATWLNKGCWDDDPSGVPVIDEAGNLVAIEQPQPQQSQRNGFPGAADELIEEFERNGGRWI